MSEAGLYDLMSAWMTGINAKPIATNRRMVALWIKKHGSDNVQRVFDHVKAKANPPQEPIGYIGKLLASGVSSSEPMGTGGDSQGAGLIAHHPVVQEHRANPMDIPAHRDTVFIRRERDAILRIWAESHSDWLARQSQEARHEAEHVARSRAWLLAQHALLTGVQPPLEFSDDDLQGVLDRVATRRGWKAEETAQSSHNGQQEPPQAEPEEHSGQQWQGRV